MIPRHSDALAHDPSLVQGRGEISEAVVRALSTGAPPLCSHREAAGTDPWGEDLQLALYLLYELHYRGLAGVDADREWDPDLLRLRRGAGVHRRGEPAGRAARRPTDGRGGLRPPPRRARGGDQQRQPLPDVMSLHGPASPGRCGTEGLTLMLLSRRLPATWRGLLNLKGGVVMVDEAWIDDGSVQSW
ncbi:hypothetical protein GCM10010222_12150 [Streptomyces tanashiensis]|nr:hypothetical protein GCM10010222_12150 [Streptomyces tanashiensis]